MSTVLVVDDVADYCEEIALSLTRAGYSVSTATSGHEAIIKGSTLRPTILVTDWMLKDQLNGLDVVEALQLVCPSLQPILMTGYMTRDLVADAQVAGVFEFVEKPFNVQSMRQIVASAEKKKRWWDHHFHIGFIEVGPKGEISFANDAAEDMMAQTNAGPFTPNFADLLPAEEGDKLEKALHGWVDVHPIGNSKLTWSIRGRVIEKTNDRAYVVLDEHYRGYQSSALVNRILGIEESGLKTIGGTLQGHILVIDDYESVRRMMGDICRGLRCVCHTAESEEEAVRIFMHDGDVRYIFLDYEIPALDPRELVLQFKALRPDVEIVGMSTESRRALFSRLGVHRYLQKPWNEDDLTAVLNEFRKREVSN